MKNLLIEVLNYFKLYNGKNIWWILVIVSLIYFFFLEKKIRSALVYPVLICGFFIFNPVLYKFLWIKMIGNTYWRLFWGIPSVFLLAFMIVDVVRKIFIFFNFKKDGFKIVGIILLSVIFIFSGSYMYTSANFEKKENEYKIPQSTIDVADELLSLNDEPRVIAVDSNIYNYIRQYSSSIKLMYGRDSEGYITDMDINKKNVRWLYNQKWFDYSTTLEATRNLGYEFIVMSVDKSIDFNQMAQYNYEFYKQVDEYNIFRDVEKNEN